MKIEDIKELLVMFKEAEITGLELETEDFYINFKNESNFVTTTDFKPQIIESKQVSDKELTKSE